MQLSERINVSQLHHAYILENFDGIDAALRKLLHVQEQTEMHVRHFETFGIDESRELVHLAQMRSQGVQVFIYVARSCTREAQNALLKLFEEPPVNTHFFLCVDTVQSILPTLRSRSWMIASDAVEKPSEPIETFMKGSLKERLTHIEEIVKEKNTTRADALLCDIEEYMYTHDHIHEASAALKHILHVRRVLYDKGASLKILLESVALTTPRFS